MKSRVGAPVPEMGRASMRLAEASTQDLEEALLLRKELSQGLGTNKIGGSEAKKQKVGDSPGFGVVHPTILDLADGDEDMDGRDAYPLESSHQRPNGGAN